ncbi:hypothetical protein PTKIN_Ptkin10aG0169200 [Pterospermum kingtungense]
MQVKLGELEAELIEMNANGENRNAGEFFASAQHSATAQQREMQSRQMGEESIETPLLLEQETSTDLSKQVKLGFITGLVPREKFVAFERILFRATRGNVFLKKVPVEEPVTDPFSREKVSGRISEPKTAIDAGLLYRDYLLWTFGDQFEQWNLKVKKEKSIYHTLNILSLDVTKKCLVAEGLSPVFATKQIQEALQWAAFDSNSQVEAIFQFLFQLVNSPRLASCVIVLFGRWQSIRKQILLYALLLCPLSFVIGPWNMLVVCTIDLNCSGKETFESGNLVL